MFKKFFFIAVLFSCHLFCIAQKRNYIWTFGDSSGINFSNLSNPVAFPSGMDSRGSCTSISDSNGILLFYASNPYPPLYYGGVIRTGAVYTKNHLLMQNGDTIVGRGWYNEQIIIPKTDSTNLFYVFSAGVTSIYGFYYSVVDLSLNGGLGAVTQKNIQLQSFPNVDCLNAIKHGNGRDWWIFFRRYDPNGFPTIDEFHSYLITPSGITNYSVQHVGSGSWTGASKLTFSKQGNKLAFVSYAGLMEIYDFDRCTGVISNPVNVFQEVTMPPVNRFVGCEFSPNGNLLYVTITDDTSYLFQFDLTAANIAASIDTIWQTSYPTEAIGALKRGPDNKIYQSGPYTNPSIFIYPYPDSMYNMYNMYLGVINHPDSLGAACDFQPYSFYLGSKRTYWGLPNNPDYDMPALAGSPCDTLTGLTPDPAPKERGAELFVTWVSEWQKLFVNAQKLKGKNVTLEVFDVAEKILFSTERRNPLGSRVSAGYFTQDIFLPHLSAGVYFVKLQTEKEVLSRKFVVSE